LRLLEPAAFKCVFANASKNGDGKLLILVHENGLDHPRLGLAISKKMLRRAVDRNRVKRMIRESFRRYQHKLGPVDVVVLARNGCQAANRQQLLHSLTRHWQWLVARACA